MHIHMLFLAFGKLLQRNMSNFWHSADVANRYNTIIEFFNGSCNVSKYIITILTANDNSYAYEIVVKE